MIRIEASLLAADAARLGDDARGAQAAGVDGFHVDVMDGRFVPNLAFGPSVLAALRPLVRVPLTVHLMVEEPERHLAAFRQAGADRLIVHQETCPHLARTLQTIRDLGAESGVALNPGTPASILEEILDLADLILVMTVNPGFGGQSFLPGPLGKLRRLRLLLDDRGLRTILAVDGGVDAATAPLAAEAGARALVAGSSLFQRAASVAENLAALRQSVRP